jgi:adenylosuccinate lyase
LLDVEAALVQALAKVGKIPDEAAKTITRYCNTKHVDIKKVQSVDQDIHHETMAVVQVLTEKVGKAGRYIHLGATSSDILDTALSLQIKSAYKLLEKNLLSLVATLVALAEAHISTVCVGRTHGQHAIPTTYGMKFANWIDESIRHLDRLLQVKKRVLVCKMSGAVGTMASFGKDGEKIQALVAETLELKPVNIATQVISRDIHAEVITMNALIAGTLEKIAKEIRNLQRTEISEIFEPFTSKQVGSSTLGQKRNPHKSERICGLARILRSHVGPALETIALEHERDITNSSVERITIPESFIILDYMISQCQKILSGLEFNQVKIKQNLQITDGKILAERIMIELVNKGISRKDAYKLVREASIESIKTNEPYINVLSKELQISQLISRKELEELMNPSDYLGTAKEQVNKICELAKTYLK